MLLVFFVICAILLQIKIEALLEGKAFDDFLMLIDRNTGVGGLNNWIILTASAALLVSIFIYGSDFIPLQAAMLIGAWVNRKYVSREPWKVADYDEEEGGRLPEWTDGSDDEDENNNIIQTSYIKNSKNLNSNNKNFENIQVKPFEPKNRTDE